MLTCKDCEYYEEFSCWELGEGICCQDGTATFRSAARRSEYPICDRFAQKTEEHERIFIPHVDINKGSISIVQVVVIAIVAVVFVVMLLGLVGLVIGGG